MALDPKWTRTVDDGVRNKAWDEYDPILQREVNDYNRRLSKTTGFVPLDLKIFKAMIWTESGGPSNPVWKTRPMQIGNTGDPGLATLRGGKEGSLLIMSDALARDVKAGNISTPDLNIRAGIAYALTRMINSEEKSVVDPTDPTVRDYSVVAGDSLAKIAGKVGSTLAALQALNPGVSTLRVGQKLKYRKAKIQRVITSWRAVNSSNLAARYNSGDPDYKAKLDYVLALLDRLQR